jgi:chromatin remodeling complex protein RSC6
MPTKTTKKCCSKKRCTKKTATRKPNAAFMAPMTPNATLACIVGEKAIPRTEITKKIWAYIKKNGLQDAKNRRQINADEKLKVLFGGKKSVTMFELTKHVNNNLVK